MKNNLNEEFLMSVLRFYYHDEETNNWAISKATIKAAIDKTLSFLVVEDRVNSTTHAEIFKVTMIEQKISVHNCTTIGISRRTFYRYKKRYLEVFKTYLLQYID